MRNKLFVTLCLYLILIHSTSMAGSEYQNIAPLADVTAEPQFEPETLSNLTDGNPRTALLFKAGTQGEGTIVLRFHKPREIVRVRLMQNSDVYFSTACEITGDDGSGKFSMMLARTEHMCLPGDWQEFNFQPVRVRALRFKSLAGVSKGQRAHPALGEFEVWGKPEPEDLEDFIRLGIRPQYISRLKPMFIETELVVGGKPACVIHVPPGEAYATMGKLLADAIERRSHVRIPVTADAATAPTQHHVIALGQMLNNRLIERLFWNRYVFLDSAQPGGNGYCIQSVHNPYPWTAGRNVIVLGGSTEAGVRRAVEAFIRLLPSGPDLRLGYLLKIERPGSRHSAFSASKGQPTELLSFLSPALSYLTTGEATHLEEAKRGLLAMADVYDKEPDRSPTWPEETHSRYILAAWDAVEEAPVFTDAERLRITNMLLRFMYSLIPKTSGFATLEKNDTIIWNHTTFPLMGLYVGGRYFRRYYAIPYMDIFLRKVLGAFSGQEKSWKPQCDADSYLVVTMGHLIEYCLAENRMGFFTSGLCRAYADYLMGVCDNRGLAPGFGDSGIVRTPSIPLAGVPFAFWFYRDGRYLWYLNAITEGKWVNPYHTDVNPVPPEDLIGLRVYRLDRQVYEFTKTRSYYNEPLSPPNIPYEQAFDKITFRENLDPNGQFFILDGYARGKHLHYDGNAILKFTQDGEDWLVDGDYLVRNTTEHNMVTVLRDGRCEEMIPVCAGLLHNADLNTRAFTVTVVKDYNGVDWERYISWRKGDWVLVTDRLRAVKPGRYSFDCVWKCIDRNEEEVVDGRRLQITRGPSIRRGHWQLECIIEPEAKEKEAVIFTQQTSQFQTVVNLPKGDYRVVVFGRGEDASTDSVWLTIDASEPVAHPIPVGKLGPSPATHIKITESGAHLLTVTLREGPGVVMDRIVFEPTGGGAPIEVLAAKAPPAPRRQDNGVQRFHVVNADSAGLSLVRRLGSSGPVKMLFQRQSATLRQGESIVFRNLLYLDKKGEQKRYDVQPLAASHALLLAGGKRIIACDGLEVAGLSSDAAIAEIGADYVCVLDATRLAGSQELLAASHPLSLEFNLETGATIAVTDKDTEIKLAGNEPVRLAPGRHRIHLIQPNMWRQEVEQALAKTAPSVSKPVAKPAAPSALEPFREIWRYQPPPMSKITDLTSSDLAGDGHMQTLVCAGRSLLCLDSDGKERWRFTCKSPLLCVCVADLNGDKRPEVLCGGQDKFFHILDSNGRLVAEHEMTERLVVGQGGTTLPFVKTLAAADLDGDDVVEIVAGCTNSHVSAFRATDLARLWNFSGIYHGAGRVALIDLDGDGKRETLVSDHYGSLHVISPDGRRKVQAYSELGDVTFDAGDIDGDGRLELLNGSSTGVFTATAYPIKPVWSFNNYGYAARVVLARDLDDDGKAEAIVGFDSGYLFALGSDGRPKWQCEVGSAILALAYIPLPGSKSKLLAGLRDGLLLVISQNGKISLRSPRPAPIVKIHPLGARPGDASRLLLLDEANTLYLVELRE